MYFGYETNLVVRVFDTTINTRRHAYTLLNQSPVTSHQSPITIHTEDFVSEVHSTASNHRVANQSHQAHFPAFKTHPLPTAAEAARVPQRI
jgi:hypothetical protein